MFRITHIDISIAQMSVEMNNLNKDDLKRIDFKNAITALNKQRPLKVNSKSVSDDGEVHGYCVSCRQYHVKVDTLAYCSRCGQLLDWD